MSDRSRYLSDFEKDISIGRHLKWLDGEMPSKRKNLEEKDFTYAPIFQFYLTEIGTRDILYKLWKVGSPPDKREVFLKELQDLLKFIKGP